MLTDRLIRTAKVRKGLNQRELRDQKVQGLVCRVYKTGVRVWFLFYRRKEDNRRRHLKLGAYPGVSLAQARELAEIELGRIAAGEDPQAQREELRAQPPTETVAELA
jgi:hypothetical protein